MELNREAINAALKILLDNFSGLDITEGGAQVDAINAAIDEYVSGAQDEYDKLKCEYDALCAAKKAVDDDYKRRFFPGIVVDPDPQKNDELPENNVADSLIKNEIKDIDEVDDDIEDINVAFSTDEVTESDDED